MVAEIYVISGFLGAGKTTLIQKLLSETFENDKVVLIENDFGEISVDAALLKDGSIEVKELNSGCICCSLSGDFVKSIEEIVERFHPDKIIIEPSGVGKLSDVIKACADPRINKLIRVKDKITVVDVKRCKKYLDNFGDFFEDQIQHADIILLSRTEGDSDKIEKAYDLINDINSHPIIISKPWTKISADEVLTSHYTKQEETEYEQEEFQSHKCRCEDQNEQAHHCSCEHKNFAEDTFDTVTIRTKRIFSMRDIKVRIEKMEQKWMGNVLRVKGIIHGANGYMNLQYLPGDLQITSCTTSGDVLCIIGQNLNQQELVSLFCEG